MLAKLSAAAALILMELLLLTAAYSVTARAWQYTLWAGLVVLLWAQPWSRKDKYITPKPKARVPVYLLLALGSASTAFVFSLPWAYLVTLEILLLMITEITGRSSLRTPER
ncbi:MAG: hypothetical protein L0Z70_08340 [Chloroflexi bacterium]|nr:hypothetical protein [Chloroflexota bacterium]